MTIWQWAVCGVLWYNGIAAIRWAIHNRDSTDAGIYFATSAIMGLVGAGLGYLWNL